MDRIIPYTDKHVYPQQEPQEGYECYNEDWLLSECGDMMNRRTLYEIDNSTLDKDDWLLVLADKRWFDANTFIPAYFEACRRKSIKEVLVRISY